MRITKAIWFMPFLFATCRPDAIHNTPINPDNKPNLRTLSAGEAGISVANNDFAFNLFRDIQKQNVGSNVFISPLSVSMALGMALNGAGDSTRESILRTIQFGNLTLLEVDQAYKDLTELLLTMDRKVGMDLANSVWYNNHYSVKSVFSGIIQAYFSGEIRALDFSDPDAPKTINSWVESKTNHKIKNLIGAITPDEVMFLINAIYFKGEWTTKFEASQTENRPFTGEDNVVQQVKMMVQNGGKSKSLFRNNFTLVDIPYGNQQFSMTILMPENGNTVQRLTQILTSDSLNRWVSQSNEMASQIKMPKFEMTWKSDLKNNLMRLGMAMKGFPNLFDQTMPLEITQVIHQSSIEVNEEGSVAVAATGVGVGITSVGPDQSIEINRPFVYLIREKHSGVILFMGQLYTPQSN